MNAFKMLQNEMKCSLLTFGVKEFWDKIFNNAEI